MQEYLEKLNKQQYDAATTIDGMVMVYAGAGSGKTATLISRVAYMIDSGIDAKNILLLTFTNKAAKEMKERAENMIGANAQDITACTFHSFCANFMRKNSRLININPDFNIIDSTDAVEAISIAKENFISKQKKDGTEYDLKDFPSAKVIGMINAWAINSCTKLDEIIDKWGMNGYKDEITEIVNDYINYKREKNILDYDDLLLYTERILNKCEDIRKYIDEKYKYKMVDEYQDTNRLQEKLLDLITKDNTNLMVVGDCNQSIYKFRCAEIENILTFENRHPGCKVVTLYENYRSSQQILDLPNMFMKYAEEGEPVNLHGQFEGEMPVLKMVDNQSREDEFIYEKIRELHRKGIPLRSMAVITRSASQTYGLEALLTRCGIGFEKFGGIKFLEKTIVKDVLSFLRVSENNKDEIALYRILKLYPGIGKGFAQKIASHITNNGFTDLEKLYGKKKFYPYIIEIMDTINNLHGLNVVKQLGMLLEDYYPEIIYRVIDNKDVSDTAKAEAKKQFDKDLEDAKALYQLAEKYKTTKSFLDDIVLDATLKDKDGDYINITTVHSAKGLEYEVVFVMNVVEGGISRSSKGDEEDPEELRVFYVACTRAKKYLYLIAPLASFNKRNKLSHFINEDDILEVLELDGEKNMLDNLRFEIDFFDY